MRFQVSFGPQATKLGPTKAPSYQIEAPHVSNASESHLQSDWADFFGFRVWKATLNKPFIALHIPVYIFGFVATL